MDYSDSRGERQRKHCLSKKAADAFRIQIEGQMQAGTYRPNADKVTVKEVCESFVEHCKGRNERDERMTRKMLVVLRQRRCRHSLVARRCKSLWIGMDICSRVRITRKRWTKSPTVCSPNRKECALGTGLSAASAHQRHTMAGKPRYTNRLIGTKVRLIT